MWRIGGRDDGFPGFEGAFVEPSPRTPSGEPPTIGGFGEADVAMVMLQLNLVRQTAEAEEFERAVALASDADVTVVLIDPGGEAEDRPAQRTSLTLRKATKGDEEMNDLPTKILVATDGLQNAVAARSAAEIARAFGSELHVVHVVPITEPYHLFDKDAEGPSLYEEDRQRAQELLDEQVRRIEENGGKVTNVYLRTGEPEAEVVSLGEEIGANMIVAGSRGLGRLRRPVRSGASLPASRPSALPSTSHSPRGQETVVVSRREFQSSTCSRNQTPHTLNI